MKINNNYSGLDHNPGSFSKKSGKHIYSLDKIELLILISYASNEIPGGIVDKDKVIECLNDILEHELAGVVRYTHYSFMIFGHNRIPIVKWFRGHADESLLHAYEVGEHITTLGGHPSLAIGKLLETHQHSINEILKESLDHETSQVDKYKSLLKMIEGKSVFLEEYARKMISEEELHISEVEKMMKK